MDIAEFVSTVSDESNEVDDTYNGKVYVYMGDGVFRQLLSVSVSDTERSLVLSIADEPTSEDDV